MRIKNITIGTAGHIDHGKSALVQALTGIHPDRLKEEQDRGMTIDLGFSCYNTSNGLHVGVIDVPGHEHFIKNMAAGANAIDLVILVVAADDGVMPQTREHLNILGLLGARLGVVALTKIDLADDEMIQLATEDIQDLVHGTFLEKAPIIPVSSMTGQGLPELKKTLDRILENRPDKVPCGLFRMPIQRVFSVKGFGAVVTGVPNSGSVKIGDKVELYPKGLVGKVRGIQVFGETCKEGKAGHRAALNLSNVDFRSLKRGDVAGSPQGFKTTSYFEAELKLLNNVERPIRNFTGIRVHLGTAEIMGRLLLLDRHVLKPGTAAPVQIKLESPIVAAINDFFMIRLQSPKITLGGGRVVGINSHKLKSFKGHVIRMVSQKIHCGSDLTSIVRIEAETRWDPIWRLNHMTLAVNHSVDQVKEAIGVLLTKKELYEIGQDKWIHKKRFTSLATRLLSLIRDQHQLRPLAPYIDIKLIKAKFKRIDQDLTDLFRLMERRGMVDMAKGGFVRVAGFVPTPTEKQIRIMEQIKDKVIATQVSPPCIRELFQNQNVSTEEADSIVDYLVSSGEFVKVRSFVYHAPVVEMVRNGLQDVYETHGEVKLALLRDRFQTSRKWMGALMDYFYTSGLPYWNGKKRY